MVTEKFLPEVFTGIKHSYLDSGVPNLGLYLISLIKEEKHFYFNFNRTCEMLSLLHTHCDKTNMVNGNWVFPFLGQ